MRLFEGLVTYWDNLSSTVDCRRRLLIGTDRPLAVALRGCLLANSFFSPPYRAGITQLDKKEDLFC